MVVPCEDLRCNGRREDRFAYKCFFLPIGLENHRFDYSIERSAWRESTSIGPKDLTMILSNMLCKTYHASDSKVQIGEAKNDPLHIRRPVSKVQKTVPPICIFVVEWSPHHNKRLLNRGFKKGRK